MLEVSWLSEALRAVAEFKTESGFGRGGRCDAMYFAPRLDDDAVLIFELPREGRGRASERRGLGVDMGKTCCYYYSRRQAIDMAIWQTQGSARFRTNGDLGMGACSQMHDNGDALSCRAHSSMQERVRCVEHKYWDG